MVFIEPADVALNVINIQDRFFSRSFIWTDVRFGWIWLLKLHTTWSWGFTNYLWRHAVASFRRCECDRHEAKICSTRYEGKCTRCKSILIPAVGDAAIAIPV